MKSILKKRIYYVLFFTMLSIFFIPMKANAAEDGLKFSVHPILPDSQFDRNNSYFDLNLEPGEKETLGLELVNGEDKEITLAISAHSAYTNIKGVVEYGKDAETYDPSLNYFLEDIIKTPAEVTLEAGETKSIELEMTMPEESFEGVLAGGIRVEKVESEEEKTNEQEQQTHAVTVKNVYSVVIGVVVSNQRNIITPELDLVDVYPDQVSSQNVVTALIQNAFPTFVNQLEVEATIHKEGESETFAEIKESQMQMAPNSDFAFPIPLNGESFKSGKYIADITARSKEQEWHWTKEFTVTRDVAKRLNQADVYVENKIDWKLIVLILLVVLVAYLIYQNHKRIKK